MVAAPGADLMTMWSSLQMQLDAHRPDFESVPEALTEHAVPVSLLTGFLGAGKSTLLAALLSEPPAGTVIRALVNDVGTLSFDPTLVERAEEIAIELSNGCGCCAATGQVAATLRKLSAANPDLIVLEASGLADPLALAQIVEADATLRLDRIVAVVDGVSATASLGDAMAGPVIRRQLHSAHVVVLSHADLLRADDLAEAIELLQIEAPGCNVRASTLSESAAEVLVPGSRVGARAMPAISQNSNSGHALMASTIAPQVALTPREVEAVLAASRPGVVRVKGRMMLHGHSHLVQMTPSTMTVRLSETVPGVANGLTVFAHSEVEIVQLARALSGP